MEVRAKAVAHEAADAQRASTRVAHGLGNPSSLVFEGNHDSYSDSGSTIAR